MALMNIDSCFGQVIASVEQRKMPQRYWYFDLCVGVGFELSWVLICSVI